MSTQETSEQKQDDAMSRAERRRKQKELADGTKKLDAVIMQRACAMSESATMLLMMGIPVEVLHEMIDNVHAEFKKQKPEIEKIYTQGAKHE